jgi:hypothetical protein
LADLPGGFFDLGGSVIGTHVRTLYSFAHVCRGNKHQIRLQRLVSRDETGKAIWNDVESLSIPRLSADELLVYGRWSTCSRGGRPDPAIIAIVVKTDEPEFRVIRSAWRANLETEKITHIPHTGIICKNEGYGI